jgi:phage-related minor tail protein
MADDGSESVRLAELDGALERVQGRTAGLLVSANGFASAMTRAFSQSVVGGKQFDDVLKQLVLRLSGMAVTAAFKPVAGGLSNLFAGLVGAVAANGAVKPFAAGGVIGTPTYFPLGSGGVGLAGEAGPEAIMPLRRGPDGRLGVAAGGGARTSSVTIHIATPDADSFRRSESYITGQIARAVARGQRSL